MFPFLKISKFGEKRIDFLTKELKEFYCDLTKNEGEVLRGYKMIDLYRVIPANDFWKNAIVYNCYTQETYQLVLSYIQRQYRKGEVEMSMNPVATDLKARSTIFSVKPTTDNPNEKIIDRVNKQKFDNISSKDKEIIKKIKRYYFIVVTEGLLQKGAILSKMVDKIKNGLSSANANVGNRLSDMGQSFSYGFSNITSTVSNAMNNIGQSIRGTASSFGNYVSSGLSTLSSTFTNTFNGILSSVVNWGSNMYTSAVNSIQNMISGMKQAFSNIVKDFTNIGANIVNGIISGFTNTWDKFVYKVKQGVEDVKALFQSMFDIHSPSRWFKWIGEMCVAGFDEGFSDFGNNSLDNVNTKLNSTLGSVQASVSGGQVGLGGYTQIINVNQQISTPDELARAIRNETRMGIMTGAYA